MVNSLEDVKYRIAIEFDLKTFNRTLNKVLKNTLKLVQETSDKMEVSLGRPFNKMSLANKKNLDIITRDIATNIAKRNQIEKQGSLNILKTRKALHKASMGFMKEESNRAKALNYQKAYMGKGIMKSNPIDTIARGALYRVGAMITNGLTQGFSNFLKTDFEIRSAVTKSSPVFNNDIVNKYKDEASRISSNVPFTTYDIAKAIKNGAMLGLTGDRLINTTELSTKLAIATGDSLEGALSKTVKIANAYDIKRSKETENLLSQILVATNKSAMDMNTVAIGMTYLGANAHSKGVDTANSLALLGILNSSGLDGSKAGTSANQFLTRLVQNKPRAELENLIGRSVKDKDGNLDIRGVMVALNNKLKGMNKVDRGGILNSLFGIRAERSVNIFMSKLEEYDDLVNQIKNSQGQLNKQFNDVSKGMYYKIVELISKTQLLIETIWLSLEPILKPIVVVATKIVSILTVIAKKFPTITRTLTLMGSTLLSLSLWKLIETKILIVKETLVASYAKILSYAKSLLSIQGMLKIGLYGIVFAIGYYITKMGEAIEKNEHLQYMWSITKKTFFEILGIVNEIFATMFGIDIKGLTEDANNFRTTLRIINTLLIRIKENLIIISDFFKNHPTLAKIIGIGTVILLIVVKIVGGITAIFKSVSFIFGLLKPFAVFLVKIIGAVLTFIGSIVGLPAWVVGLIAAALIAIGVLVYKFRNQIIGVFKAIGQGIVDAFNWAIDKVKGLWQSFIGFFKSNKPTVDVNNKNLKTTEDYRKSLGESKRNYVPTIQNRRNATGTNNYTSSLPTTLNERGDEAVFLPFGSMVANNNTTRQMLMELKGIRNNGTGTTVVTKNEFGNINITIQGSNDTAEDIEKSVRNIFEKLAIQ